MIRFDCVNQALKSVAFFVAVFIAPMSEAELVPSSDLVFREVQEAVMKEYAHASPEIHEQLHNTQIAVFSASDSEPLYVALLWDLIDRTKGYTEGWNPDSLRVVLLRYPGSPNSTWLEWWQAGRLTPGLDSFVYQAPDKKARQFLYELYHQPLQRELALVGNEQQASRIVLKRLVQNTRSESSALIRLQNQNSCEGLLWDGQG